MNRKQANIAIKRAYEPVDESDGERILVDRMWPRGMTKDALHINAWLRELAPSTELRRWFNHETTRWPEFARRYREELQAAKSQALLDGVVDRAMHGPVTLVYSARDAEHNQAVVLHEVLEERMAATERPRRTR